MGTGYKTTLLLRAANNDQQMAAFATRRTY